MTIKKIGHVGIAAANADKTIAFFTEKLGGKLLSKELVPDQKLVSSMVLLGDDALEIMEATEPDSVVAKYIEKKGEGIHHISLTVEHICDLVESLEMNGVHVIGKQLISDKIKFAFISPKDTGGILIELVEICDCCSNQSEDSK